MKEFVPVGHETLAQIDELGPVLRVTSLLESGAFRRRCSDAFLRLPTTTEAGDDLYCVCDVLPQDPTDDQLGDLAFRLSSFLEGLRVLHVDRRWDESVVRMLSVPMRIPIMDRKRWREIDLHQHLLPEWGGILRSCPTETYCMTYLELSRWTGHTRQSQLLKIDEAARRHGLRCVEIGVLPEP